MNCKWGGVFLSKPVYPFLDRFLSSLSRCCSSRDAARSNGRLVLWKSDIAYLVRVIFYPKLLIYGLVLGVTRDNAIQEQRAGYFKLVSDSRFTQEICFWELTQTQ